MELTQGNMAALFQNLRGEFRAAVRDAPIPESVKDFVLDIPSSTSEEHLPTAALLGDLEMFLDELAYTNLGQWMQEVENVLFARGLEIPVVHLEDDQLSMYPTTTAALGRRAATHPYRLLPQFFIDGLITAWVDGANVWSNAHAWPGGQVWDNLDLIPLSPAGFATVCANLMGRLGPDGQPLELSPTHLVVGPALWNVARQVIHRELVGGGNTNIHYEEVKVINWARFRGAAAYYWFVADLSDAIKPVAITNRSGPDFYTQDEPTDDARFNREVIRYKARRRYGQAILAPWLVQFSAAEEDPVTTTAA